MRPTPNQIIRGVRDLLREDIAPEIKDQRALRGLRKIMAVLRDVDWDEAGFRLASGNATLRALAREALVWIGETGEREAAFRDAGPILRAASDAAESDQSYARTHETNLALRGALAGFIEAAATRRPHGLERAAAANMRAHIARALAGLWL